jgi:hypothetical protein
MAGPKVIFLSFSFEDITASQELTELTGNKRHLYTRRDDGRENDKKNSIRIASYCCPESQNYFRDNRVRQWNAFGQKIKDEDSRESSSSLIIFLFVVDYSP